MAPFPVVVARATSHQLPIAQVGIQGHYSFALSIHPVEVIDIGIFHNALTMKTFRIAASTEPYSLRYKPAEMLVKLVSYFG